MIHTRPGLTPPGWLSISIITCAIGLSAAGGNAQPRPPSLRGKLQLTPFFGTFQLEDRNYDDASFGGVRIGRDISSRYSIEGGLG